MLTITKNIWCCNVQNKEKDKMTRVLSSWFNASISFSISIFYFLFFSFLFFSFLFFSFLPFSSLFFSFLHFSSLFLSYFLLYSSVMYCSVLFSLLFSFLLFSSLLFSSSPPFSSSFFSSSLVSCRFFFYSHVLSTSVSSSTLMSSLPQFLLLLSCPLYLSFFIYSLFMQLTMMNSSNSRYPLFWMSNWAKSLSPKRPFKGKYCRNVSLHIPDRRRRICKL